MEAPAFPRGKLPSASGSAPADRDRHAAATERLFGAKRSTSAGDGAAKSSSTRPLSSHGGAGGAGTSGKRSSSAKSRGGSDFEPSAADNHTVRRADELTFKVCLGYYWRSAHF